MARKSAYSYGRKERANKTLKSIQGFSLLNQKLILGIRPLSKAQKKKGKLL